MKFLLAFSLILFLLSCNDSSSNGSAKKGDGNDGDKDDGMTCIETAEGQRDCESSEEGKNPNRQNDVVIEDTEGREYFEQFLFKKEDVGDDPDFPEYQFRFLMAGMFRDFTSVAGEKMGANLGIGLFEDGSFKVKYLEIKYTGNGTFQSTGCKETAGTWSVINNFIELDINGTIYLRGRKIFKDNQHMILFSLERPLLSDNAIVIGFDMGLGYTNIGYPEKLVLKCSGF